MMHKLSSQALLLSLVLSISPISLAAEADPSGAPGEGDSCKSGSLLSGKLMSDICWKCIFPIYVAGVKFKGGGDFPDDSTVTDKLCACQDNQGVYNPGFVMGNWAPARVVETVKMPGCSPSLGGAKLSIGSKLSMGQWSAPATSGDNQINTQREFMHYHYYAFPLLNMLDIHTGGMSCNRDGFHDMDLLYLSEVDPTWNSEVLAFFTHPEAALVANPIAMAACVADVVKTINGKPMESLFWCMGQWGSVYPMSGYAKPEFGFAAESARFSTRTLAALHRRGLAWRTLGEEAQCGSYLYPTLPKQQYKFTMFYPKPDTQRSHWIGETTMRWGQFRSVPGVHENSINVIFRWSDCCVTTSQ